MVCLDGIAGDHYYNTNDKEQAVNDSPPSEWREVTVGIVLVRQSLILVGLNLGDDARNKSNKPGKLLTRLLVNVHATTRKRRVEVTLMRHGKVRIHESVGRPTREMEMVANAKGSPRILPSDIRFRPPYGRECSIFTSDGEYCEA